MAAVNSSNLIWSRFFRRLWMGAAVVIIVLALGISLLRVGLGFSDGLIPRIEQQLTDLIGEPVHVGDLKIQWRVLNARLMLADLRLVDATSEQALFGVGELHVDVHVLRSLWRRQLVFTDLLVRQADIHVLRDADGLLSVYGPPVGMDTSAQSGDWNVLEVLAGQRLTLQGGRLRWEDRVLGIDYQFEDLQLSIFTEAQRVQMAGQVFLPIELGYALSVAMDMRMGDSAADWSGLAYIRAHELLGAGLPLQVRQQWGLASAEMEASIWLNWDQGHIRRIQMIASADDLMLMPRGDAPTPETVTYDHLAGHFYWAAQESGWLLRGDDLRLQRGTRFWPGGGFDLEFTQQQQASLWRGHLDYARWEDIWPLFLAQQAWPLPSDAAWLSELSPEGSLDSISGALRVSPESPPEIEIQGSFRDLSMNPTNGIPGFSGIQADFAFFNTQGELSLFGDDVVLVAPKVFAEPLRIQTFNAPLTLQRQDEGLTLVGEAIELANDDFQLHLQAQIEMQDEPAMNLTGQFGRADVRHVPDYLPREIMPPVVVDWLDTALLHGEIDQGELSFSGRFRDFPFKTQEGHLEVRADVRDVGLQFHRDWPPAEQVNATLFFTHQGMEVREGSGRLQDVPVADLAVQIADFEKPELTLEGIARGDIAKFQAYLLDTPLGEPIASWFAPLEVQGLGQLDLSLQMALKDRQQHAEPDRLQGRFMLLGNRLASPTLPWPLEDISGDLRFDRHTLESRRLTARLHDAPLRLEARREPDAHIYLEALGQQAIEHLSASLPEILRDNLSGAALWRAQLHFAPDAPPHLRLRSDTRGIHSSLPAILGKPADQAWPMDLSMDLLLEGPTNIQLRLGEPDTAGTFLLGQQQEGEWLWRLEAPEVMGVLHWPARTDAQQPVSAEFERFTLEEWGFLQADKDRARVDPRALPPLDVVIRELRLGERRFQEVRWQSQPFAQGLRLLSASLQSPNQDLQAELQGEWRVTSQDEHRTSAQLQVSGSNLGSGLSDWNIVHNISGGRLQASADLSWPGAPTYFDLKFANAEGRLRVDEGRLLEVDPGAGRWLGLFSLNMLPRRLALDFRDVFQRGLVFDELTASFQLHEGQLYTPDLQVKGPAARIDIRGRTGLIEQDYDQVILVSPNVRSTLPLAGAFLGGPVAGVAVYLFERIIGLGDRLDDSMRLEYRVTGPWDAPKVEAQVREIETNSSP